MAAGGGSQLMLQACPPTPPRSKSEAAESLWQPWKPTILPNWIEKLHLKGLSGVLPSAKALTPAFETLYARLPGGLHASSETRRPSARAGRLMGWADAIHQWHATMRWRIRQSREQQSATAMVSAGSRRAGAAFEQLNSSGHGESHMVIPCFEPVQTMTPGWPPCIIGSRKAFAA